MVFQMIRILLEGRVFIQKQIEDFLGKTVEVVLDLRESYKPYREYFGRLPRFFRRVKKLKPHTKDKCQWTLDNFSGRYLRGLGYHLLRKCMPRGFKGQRVEKSSSKGYLKDIFELNDFSYFDWFQRLNGWHTHTRCFTLKDAFKAELGRFKEVEPLHLQWLEKLESRSLRKDIGIEDKRVPSEHQYQRLLSRAAGALNGYFLQRRAECYGVRIMGSPLKIWDRRFFEVYFTKDPQAGPYMKPSYRGVGYTNSTILDSWWGLPDYFIPYNARLSDQVVFPHTLKAFMRGNGRDFTALLSDAGCDSHDNNQLVLSYGKVPIIQARENAVGEVIKTPNGHHYRGEYLPGELLPYLDKLHDARPEIERRYSLDKNYGMTKMPHKGKKWAYFFIGTGEILHLLNALTAYKIGELGLIRASSAFRRVYGDDSPGNTQKLSYQTFSKASTENLNFA